MTIISTTYQTDQGSVVRIRIDAAKAAITGNAAPAGAMTEPHIEAQVSQAGSRRKYGLNPRGVRYRRVGTGTDLNKVFTVFVPALTQASQTALLATDPITYKGNTYTTPVGVAES